MTEQPTRPLVLLLEDDEDLRTTTGLVLQRHGFDVVAAADGVEGLEVLTASRPDVAVVDIVMPKMDGITFAKKARLHSSLPIVFLTARDLPHDQLAGFEAGGDDYVIKPFDGQVLAARLRAVLRRAAPVTDDSAIQVGDLAINLEEMTVERAGAPLHLSATEFRLLEALVTNLGLVMSRSRLLDLVWGAGDWADPHVIEVNVQRLRAKIGAEHLVTVRGLGYKLVRP